MDTEKATSSPLENNFQQQPCAVAGTFYDGNMGQEDTRLMYSNINHCTQSKLKINNWLKSGCSVFQRSL